MKSWIKKAKKEIYRRKEEERIEKLRIKEEERVEKLRIEDEERKERLRIQEAKLKVEEEKVKKENEENEEKLRKAKERIKIEEKQLRKRIDQEIENMRDEGSTFTDSIERNISYMRGLIKDYLELCIRMEELLGSEYEECEICDKQHSKMNEYIREM